MASLAPALVDLRAEVDRRWPHRDKRSDGWLGDARHRRTPSDHNPNGFGVVRAIDLDVDGILAAQLAEHVRKRGAAGDRRLRGGYVIYNRRIAGTHTRWAWHAYNGSNPHTTHLHVSAADAPADYNTRGGWGVTSIGAPAPRDRILREGMSGQDVRNVQDALRRAGYRIAVDGSFGPATERAVVAFQRSRQLTADGIVGPSTWSALRKVPR